MRLHIITLLIDWSITMKTDLMLYKHYLNLDRNQHCLPISHIWESILFFITLILDPWFSEKAKKDHWYYI